jgi:hypothetical protein
MWQFKPADEFMVMASAAAKDLVMQAFEGLDVNRIIDYHVSCLKPCIFPIESILSFVEL